MDLTKRHYKIGDVVEITGIPASTLRFWESKGVITPHRNNAGTRSYTPHDIEQIRMAQYLLHDKGQSLEAVRRQLSANPNGTDRRPAVIARLAELRHRLASLVDAIDTLRG